MIASPISFIVKGLFSWVIFGVLLTIVIHDPPALMKGPFLEGLRTVAESGALGVFIGCGLVTGFLLSATTRVTFASFSEPHRARALAGLTALAIGAAVGVGLAVFYFGSLENSSLGEVRPVLQRVIIGCFVGLMANAIIFRNSTLLSESNSVKEFTLNQAQSGADHSSADEWERIQAAAPQMIRIMEAIETNPDLLKQVRELKRSESGLLLFGGDVAAQRSHAERLTSLARLVADSEDSIYDYEQWIGYHLEDILVEHARRRAR